MPRQDHLEERVLEAADRKADLAPLEIGDLAYRPVRQHHQRVEGRRHQRADALERQPGVHLHVQLGLVRDRDLGPAGGHQLGRVVGIGRGDELDLEAAVAEVALLLGHHEGRVVGVDEPVEQHREALGGGGGGRQQHQRQQ